MTTTCFEVMFSIEDVYIKKALKQNGSETVFNVWTTKGDGKYYYLTETNDQAKAALFQRITVERAFLDEAEQKYVV